jgi:hypothetical protein
VRTLTPLASEGRMHLTANGAVTLCGRAITRKWRRRQHPNDRDCNQCQHQAAAMGPAHVAPRLEGAQDPVEQAVSS